MSIKARLNFSLMFALLMVCIGLPVYLWSDPIVANAVGLPSENTGDVESDNAARPLEDSTREELVSDRFSAAASRYAGRLGSASSEAREVSSGIWQQDFERGCLVWSEETGAQPIWGDVYSYWKASSCASSLGAPVGEPREFSTAHGTGWSQDFQRGAIQWNGSAGCVSVRSGAIRSESGSATPIWTIPGGTALPA